MTTFLQQLVNGLSLGAIYALIALGYTMVYGVLRLINFAHGDVYMLGAFAGYYLARELQPAASRRSSRRCSCMLGAMVACARARDHDRAAGLPARCARAPRLTSLITAIGVSLLLENGGAARVRRRPASSSRRSLAPSADFVVGGVRLIDRADHC